MAFSTAFQRNAFQQNAFQIAPRPLPQSFFGDVDGEIVRKHWKRRQEEQDEIGRAGIVAARLAAELAALDEEATVAAEMAARLALQREAGDRQFAEQRRQERMQRMAKTLTEPEYDDDEDVIELLLQ